MRLHDHSNRIGIGILCAGLLGSGVATAEPPLSRGQTVYVPVYSEIPFGDQTGVVLVRASVLVRNTDPNHSLTIHAVALHTSEGKRILEYLKQPARLPPLATKNFDIKETDTQGGSAPSMLVRWAAEQPINPPIVEALMVSTFQGQGISFRTEGRVLTLPGPSR